MQDIPAFYFWSIPYKRSEYATLLRRVNKFAGMDSDAIRGLDKKNIFLYVILGFSTTGFQATFHADVRVKDSAYFFHFFS
jgi:hypothetical protein